MDRCERRVVNKPADAHSGLRLCARERGGQRGAPGTRKEVGWFGLELPGSVGPVVTYVQMTKAGIWEGTV